jgi:hypothetical protein
MDARRLLLLPVLALPLAAQAPCPVTPTYSPCEMVFDLAAEDAAAHPNPYSSVQLQAEFRSPRHRTFLMPAYWDGGRRMVIRFAPTEAGDWDYRLTGNIAAFNGKTGRFAAADSGSPGFIKVANGRHWATTEDNKPHLWMGDTCYRFGFIDRALFDQLVEARAKQRFNHLRGLLIGGKEDAAKIFANPDQPDVAHFRELDQRILAMNRRGLAADLVLAGDENHLADLFPAWQRRERYIRFVVARYAAMNVTWQGVQEFEEYQDGRALLKEIGLLIKKYDPYNHPRSTHTTATSAPLAGDGWMDYIVYQTSDDQIGAVEHQLHTVPQVNAEFAYEDSGAGKSHPHHVASDEFRHRLWNAAMNGQYPTFGNTGTYGGRKFNVEAKYLESPGARAMTAWYDFFARTRHWDLEPYFDVDGGRALALEGVEYIVYVEKPGPVEVLVERHGYNVAWFNPATGESIKQKDFKGERFAGEPPAKTQDWVLHISREGRKEGMLRSYKFESRPLPVQEVELNPQKVPYEVAEPAGDTISIAAPPKFAVKLKRETRATRAMMFLWTGEVVADGQGFRVLGTGKDGTLKIPKGLAKNFPAVLNLHVAALNANGKAYAIDKVYTLKP